jgi:hypothetical protein
LRKIGRARHSNGRRTPGARHSNGRRPPGARHSNGRRTPGARHSNGRRASGARHSNGRRTPGARHSNGRRPLIAHYSMAGARHSSFEWEARARCPSFEADEVVHPNGLPFRGASVVVRGIALGPRGVGAADKSLPFESTASHFWTLYFLEDFLDLKRCGLGKNLSTSQNDPR